MVEEPSQKCCDHHGVSEDLSSFTYAPAACKKNAPALIASGDRLE
jgi:hypothetical protein